ncbi:hypothetical protein ACKFKF_14405 [Phormidesmis sp. 146-12]
MRDSRPNPHFHRPYAVVAVMPGHKPREIGQFNNRSDADAMVRFLRRSVPAGDFFVTFDCEDLPGAIDTPPIKSNLGK